MSLPAISEYTRYGNGAVRAYSDWDEPYYLEVTTTVGEAPVSDLFTLQDGVPLPFHPSQYFYPHNVLDVVIGKIFHVLSLSPIELGLLLDLIIFPLAYVVFFYFFSRYTRDSLTAHGGVVACLCIPYLAIISQYIHLPGVWFENIISAKFDVWPCAPVLRGVYTQVSYPLFGLALLFGLRHNEKTFQRDLVISGLFSGLLIYVYFFSWVSVSCLISLSLIAKGIASITSGSSKREVITPLMRYLISNMILVAPAITLIIVLPATNLLNIDKELLNYWYFSPESFFLLLILAGFRLYSKTQPLKRIAEIAMLILISEFLLMNSQAFLGKFVTPFELFHFTVANCFKCSGFSSFSSLFQIKY